MTNNFIGEVWNLYEQLFNWVENHFYFLGSMLLILLIVGVTILALARESIIKRNVVRGCTIGYAIILYLITFGMRMEKRQATLVLEVRWIEYEFLSKCDSTLIWGDFANVLLFIPYGIFFCEKKYERKNFIYCMASAMFISGIIEISQLVWKRGYCDINDWIGNILGAMAGYIFYYVIYNLLIKLGVTHKDGE